MFIHGISELWPPVARLPLSPENVASPNMHSSTLLQRHMMLSRTNADVCVCRCVKCILLLKKTAECTASASRGLV